MFWVGIHARFLQLRVDRKACGRLGSQLKSQVESSEIKGTVQRKLRWVKSGINR